MGINYQNLDDITRKYMTEEMALGDHYISPRLTSQGQAAWPGLMQQAAKLHDDDWLAQQLLGLGYLRGDESYTRNGKIYSRRINQANASQQLGEGEFNRYYVRGLCVRAKAEGKTSLLVYRGKEVSHPRPESEAKIGSSVSVDLMLPILRQNDFVAIEEALGVPGGPNSGLTCKLPSA